MAGTWLVDRPGYPILREEFPTHMAAAERVAELRRGGCNWVVAWFCPDHVPPRVRLEEVA